MKKYIMSIDQGTTGSTVSVYDQSGGLVASSDQDFEQIFPKPGWVEHDPLKIWHSIENSARELYRKSNINKDEILTVGITNQRETIVAWSKKTGRPLHNAIVWQCRRTADRCRQMKSKYEKKINRKTGLLLDPYFSASKMQWLLENVDDVKKAAKQNDLLLGTIDSYLIYKLTNGKSHKTDVTNASRTMLMNLKTLDWDQDLLKLFKIPLNSLPQIQSSASDFGSCENQSWLTHRTPISGVIGDQQSALFGQACFDPGEAKCTFGTGSFILLNTGTHIQFSKAKCLTTVAWKIKNEKPVYALEGGAFICGAAVQWLRDSLGIIKNSADVEGLAAGVSDTGGVEFVPAMVGLGAPYWNPTARGEITGITRGTTSAHLARAALEAMALQNADILKAMEKDLSSGSSSGKKIKKLKSLKVDGGAAANNLLMQLQANYLQAIVVRPKILETTSMGAAYMAGLGMGLWSSLSELRKIWKVDHEFLPKISKKDLAKRNQSWAAAVKKCQI
jgi:glycerol kinase